MADPTTTRAELPTATVALAGSTVIGGGVGAAAPGTGEDGATDGGADALAAGETEGDGAGVAGVCAAVGAARHAASSASAAKERESVSLGSNFAGAVDGRC